MKYLSATNILRITNCSLPQVAFAAKFKTANLMDVQKFMDTLKIFPNFKG